MQLIILSIHLLVCVCLIGLVLLQRSEGGALGMGGGGGGALMSGRGAADALARMTQVAGGFFLFTSLALTLFAGGRVSDARSIMDLIPAQHSAPATTTPAQPQPAQPARPDPTQSSAPEAATTQLASAPAPAAATPSTVAPSPAAATTRAQPLEGRQTATAAIPTSLQQRPATPPAHPAATPPANQTTAATTPRTTAGAATQRTGAAPPPHLVIPNTSGSQTGALPTGVEPLNPESSDPNAVTTVRRERAGPDQ